MKCVKMFLLLWILTGIIYPAVITVIAKTTMNHKAEGSFIKNVGSKLIAQKFTSDNYFWPRPSNGDYNALASGGSNLGPISPALKKAVNERKAKYSSDAPSELLYTSASGLDPHISPHTAYYQIERIAKARALPKDKLIALVDHHIEKQLLGRPCVNVLELNLALDELK